MPRWKPIRFHPNLAAGPLRACCCYSPLLDEGKRLSWLSPKPAVTIAAACHGGTYIFMLEVVGLKDSTLLGLASSSYRQKKKRKRRIRSYDIERQDQRPDRLLWPWACSSSSFLTNALNRKHSSSVNSPPWSSFHYIVVQFS